MWLARLVEALRNKYQKFSSAARTFTATRPWEHRRENKDLNAVTSSFDSMGGAQRYAVAQRNLTWFQCSKLLYKVRNFDRFDRYTVKPEHRSSHFHKFHILDPSPWPFFIFFAIFTMMMGVVVYLHKLQESTHMSLYLWVGMLETIVCSFLWWDDVTDEGAEEHTDEIRYGLKVGMVLFIVSEIMFFFSFFWAFFHLSLSPSVFVGSVWPPVGLNELIINPFGVPLLNTVLLLSSGITVTVSHYYLNGIIDYMQRRLWWHQGRLILLAAVSQVSTTADGERFDKTVLASNILKFKLLSADIKKEGLATVRLVGESRWVYMRFLTFTIVLALLFTSFQVLEYVSCNICISDGIFGTTFYMLTGFHGLHVLVGTVFLTVCLARAHKGHFEDGNYIGFECAIWYWHFVDVVWLFLYIFVYLWGKTMRIVGLCPELLFETTPSHRLDGAFLSTTDFAMPKQIGFQDPASFVMENIILLHNYVMSFLILIFTLVAWFFVAILILQHTSLRSNNRHLYCSYLSTYQTFIDATQTNVLGACKRVGSYQTQEI